MQEQESLAMHRRMLTLAEESEAGLLGPEQVEWLARLDAEQDNMRAALEWSIGQARDGRSAGIEATGFGLEEGLRLASALEPYWVRRDHLIEGRERLDALLSLAKRAVQEGQAGPGGRPREEVLAKAVSAAARLAYKQGDLPGSRRLYEESLERHTTLQDPRGTAQALVGLGHVSRAYDNFLEARGYYEKALVLRRGLDSKAGVSSVLFALGRTAMSLGELGDAAAYMGEAAALDRELGDREGLAYELEAAGQIDMLQGRYESAVAQTEEALGLYRELGEAVNVSELLDTLGMLAIDMGEYSRAAAVLEEAIALARELEGDKLPLAWPLCRLGIVAARQGDPLSAGEMLMESLALFMEAEPLVIEGVSMCLLGFAGIAGGAAADGHQGRIARAARLTGAASALDESCDFVSRGFAKGELARNMAAARAGLSEEAFGAAWEEGRRMKLEQAVEYAREETRWSTPAI